MADFNDLPKAIRERIYALHLIQDEPITSEQHRKLIKHNYDYRNYRQRFMPPLLTLSHKIEKEAAPFYYAMNHFVFTEAHETWSMGSDTWPRHLRLITKVTFTWSVYGAYATEAFNNLARMKGLQELYIRVDEKEMLKRMLLRRSSHQRFGWKDPTLQQQMTILQFPGMVGLFRLLGIRHVRFIKELDGRGGEVGGPIPGGVLETEVARKVMSFPTRRFYKRSSFRFLSLSPELRNGIYDMLLRIQGPLQPSPRPPTSTSRKLSSLAGLTSPESVLSLLAVNHQVHDEAVGIFYHYNTFVFHYSLLMHGFLQSLGPQRQSFIRDITVHYADVKSGGMSMVELTFALLRRLTSLRRLEVIMHGELTGKVVRRYWTGRYLMGSANPGLIPGMRALFELRGVKDIKVCDQTLEDRFEDAKKSVHHPNFEANTWNGCTVKLTRALEHLNAALVEAQKGRVNWELLEDNKWHLRDTFPTLEDREARGALSKHMCERSIAEMLSQHFGYCPDKGRCEDRSLYFTQQVWVVRT